MNKIICSLEDWDSVIDYYRPNGSSKSWYIKELKRLSRPLMWGEWNIYSEDGEMFNNDMFKGIITPNHCNLLEYVPKDNLENRPHLYIINVYSYSFFVDNFEIGFKCVSEQYLNDVRTGKSKIVLLFLYEGYSGSIGNYDLEIIERWRTELGLPENSIYYVCGNLIIEEITKKKELKFQSRSIHCFEPWNRYNEIIPVDFKPTDEKFLFLSYNRNPRKQRIIFLIDLLENNLFDRGLVSLNKFIHEPPEDCNMELYEYLNNRTPISFDDRYDLYYNLACNITKEDYERTFISLVTESLIDEDTLFFSEKIWKPIMVGHPFMLYGNKDSLKYLKDMGYQTYDKWIDESYDNETNYKIRSKMIVNELNKFNQKSIEDLQIIRKEMNEVCLHNQNQYKKLYKEKYGDVDVNNDLCKILNEIWQTIEK